MDVLDKSAKLRRKNIRLGLILLGFVVVLVVLFFWNTVRR